MAENNIEQRLKRLEDAVFGTSTSNTPPSAKQLALSELASSKLIGSGPQKIVVIVGHNELVLKAPAISMPDIKKAWTLAKFALKPDPKQLERAIKAGLIRDADGTKEYDLTRKGEAYFQTVVEDVTHD
jgi:hypothetical protein